MESSVDFDSDFFRDRYDYELRRREELTGALSMPVGVLTVLGGAMAAMARSFSYRDRPLTWAFGILLGFAVVAVVVCMVRLARAYHPQKYMYLPLLGAIKTAKEEFLDFAKFMAGARAKCSTRSKSSSTSTSSTPRTGTRGTTTTGATSFTWLGLRSSGSWP
jgi:hypothetical protein